MNIKTIAITAAVCVLMLTGCMNGSNSDTSPKQTGKQQADVPAASASGSAAQQAQDAGFTGYVVRTDGDRMLVVSPEPHDFSANGGTSNFYEAIWFSDMPSGIELGMKVEVWAEGGVRESYPAQGTAERAEVIPSKKPAGANLSEAEVIRQGIASLEASSGHFPIITGVEYDPSELTWSVSAANNGEEGVILTAVSDREQDPDMGELYGLALDAFIPIDDVLNDDMQYIAVDMSNFENIDDTDKQQILNMLGQYDVPVKEATYEQLWAEEPREPKSMGLKGILLRVDKLELSDKKMVLEGSKFKSGKGAIGTRVVLEKINGRWQVTDAAGTWIS